MYVIGQYTLWDMSPTIKKRRPCEYSFRRYIGQKVKDHLGEHTISEIGTFYTYFTDGLCGTPHDLTPVDPVERMAAIDVDLEYFEYVAQNDSSRDQTNRNIALRNIEILKRYKEERLNR